jgi:hypothetical protein
MSVTTNKEGSDIASSAALAAAASESSSSDTIIDVDHKKCQADEANCNRNKNNRIPLKGVTVMHEPNFIQNQLATDVDTKIINSSFEETAVASSLPLHKSELVFKESKHIPVKTNCLDSSRGNMTSCFPLSHMIKHAGTKRKRSTTDTNSENNTSEKNMVAYSLVSKEKNKQTSDIDDGNKVSSEDDEESFIVVTTNKESFKDNVIKECHKILENYYEKEDVGEDGAGDKSVWIQKIPGQFG